MKRWLIVILVLAALASQAGQISNRNGYGVRGTAVILYDPFVLRTNLVGGWIVEGYRYSTNNITMGSYTVSNVHYSVSGTNFFAEMIGIPWTGSPTNTLSLDGTTKRLVQLDSAAVADNLPNMTVLFWMKSSTLASQFLISKGNRWTSPSIDMLLFDTGAVQAYVTGTGGATDFGKTVSSINLLNGAWHQVGLIVSNRAAVYIVIDGAIRAHSDLIQTGTVTTYASATPWTLGETVNQSSYRYTGLLDTVGIYSNILTSTEITNMYLNGRTGTRHQ